MQPKPASAELTSTIALTKYIERLCLEVGVFDQELREEGHHVIRDLGVVGGQQTGSVNV
jgi:hypothetical protein